MFQNYSLASQLVYLLTETVTEIAEEFKTPVFLVSRNVVRPHAKGTKLSKKATLPDCT